MKFRPGQVAMTSTPMDTLRAQLQFMVDSKRRLGAAPNASHVLEEKRRHLHRRAPARSGRARRDRTFLGHVHRKRCAGPDGSA